jgi:hypothetical protein
MAKRRKTIDEDDDDRRHTIIPDGGKVRVRMTMMDSVQRSVAKDAPTNNLLVDAGTDDPLALHKPGFRYSTNAADRLSGDVALAEAYEARELADREAWRSSVPEQRADAQSIEDAYRQYDADMAEAWRG